MDIIKGARHLGGALLFAAMVWLLASGSGFLFDQAPEAARLHGQQDASR